MDPDGAAERKVLVVFYPDDDSTARIGEELARRCGADREAIREKEPRDGLGARLRMAWLAATGAPAPIQPVRRHPAGYDLVVVGTPAWGKGPAAPVRSYLMQHAGDFRRVAFYCLSERREREATVFREMQRLCRRTPVARFGIRVSRREGLSPGEGLRRFVAALQS